MLAADTTQAAVKRFLCHHSFLLHEGILSAKLAIRV
jgi:hypothetical protein